VCGWRTVPVETGSSYLSADAGQALMTVHQFLQRCILHHDQPTIIVGDGDDDDDHNENGKKEKSNVYPATTSSTNINDINVDNLTSTTSTTPINSKKGYLAQHRLFDQIPILRTDFTVPDYCALLTTRDEEFIAYHLPLL